MDKKSVLMILAAMVLFAVTACESPPLERTIARQRVTISGDFFTESPDDLIFPVKVLFAIDCSGSMGAAGGTNAGNGSDPQGLRLTATENFINQYNSYENVSFEIMLWNSAVFARTENGQQQPGFTKDPDHIQDVIDMAENQYTTDYVSTLNAIHEDIRRDINNTQDRDNLVRTKYIVIFFSDGLDNIGTNLEPRTGEILDAIDNLYEMTVDEGVGSFALHTFLLSELLTDPADLNDCVDLLEAMAFNGGGQFREFESAEAINFIDIVDMRLTAEYRIKYMVAYNYNVKPGSELVHTDSDGDGLSDTEELNPANNYTYVSDPYNPDTDNDGMSDYLERKLSAPDNILNPQTPDSPCQTPPDGIWADTDFDGLNDCEEYVKGTNRFSPDTDLDGIPDGVEFYSGTNPLEDQINNDSDFDGVQDWLEVQTHTNVLSNDPKVRERYGYHYVLSDMGLEQQEIEPGLLSSVRRYSFSISNIQIMDTQASGNGLVTFSNVGDNAIRVYIAQVPDDLPDAPPVFRMAEVNINVNDDTRDIVLSPMDFQLIE